jgi:hypothetical protein
MTARRGSICASLPAAVKRWIRRYKLGPKTRIGTFGDAGKIGLAKARSKAFA